MGIKELKEKFHKNDAKLSSHFHKTEVDGTKKPSWVKIIITWLAMLILLTLVANAFTSINTTQSTTTPHYSEPTTPVEPQMSEKEYKAATTYIPFKQLDKNPDGKAREKVKYTGTIVQIMESGGSTEIRLALSGGYDDIIYVTYSGTTDAVEGDTVTIWGDVYGSYTYTSEANYQITLPRIDAKYITVN